MTPAPAAVPFTLEVSFTGLCLFLKHPTNGQVAIVMPDGRAKPHPPSFPDGTIADPPHVGYVSCDASDVVGPPGGMPGEIVHQFVGEALDFGFDDEAVDSTNLKLPELARITQQIRLIPGMFSQNPPDILLFRTILKGGSLDSISGQSVWTFDNSNPPGYGGAFAEQVVWTRPVYAEQLQLRLTDWRGAATSTLTLKPSVPGGTVRLRIANLCSDNTLQWDALGIPRITVAQHDMDFRFFYLLLEPTSGSWADVIVSRGGALPVPGVDPRTSVSRTTPPGCISLSATEAF